MLVSSDFKLPFLDSDLLTRRYVIGDMLPMVRLVLQDLVQVLEPPLRGSGESSAVSGIGRWLPAGVHVKLARAEQFWRSKEVSWHSKIHESLTYVKKSLTYV